MKIQVLGCVLAASATLTLTGCGSTSTSKQTSAATVAPITSSSPSSATRSAASPVASAKNSSKQSPTAPLSSNTPSAPHSDSHPSATTPAVRPGVPSNAAPGAGGPRPANATPLTESDHAEYGPAPAFKSPSGHNGCQVMTGGGGSDIRCGTLSENSGAELFMTADGQIEGPTADDAPMWPQADTLQYGQVRYYGNTVFASTEQGVTVWNTQSGHGALINTSGIHQF